MWSNDFLANMIRDFLKPGVHYTTAGVFQLMEQLMLDWSGDIRKACRDALKLAKRQGKITGGFRDVGEWYVPVLT